ncbi:MAG: sodium/proline symporter [Candidatus Neomarinimicrobiota bacterium]|nr:MAG: sodium/proline symporter [Candidatus Neomarinimicrobiota bacterium]
MADQSQIILVMVVYLSFLIGWGIWQGRKVKSQKDYAIAGRNLSGWVAALSERATGESSWALLGLPGFAYAAGLTSVWTAVGCVTGIIVAWWLIAFRLQEEAKKYDVNSFTEFIARRHGAMEKPIRIVSSFMIVFFFFFYVGAQFLGGGKTLNAMFGMDPALGMLLTACIIVPYTVYGGFRSVVYTDVIQAIVMIVTLILGPLAGLLYLKNHPGLFAGSLPEALRLAGSSYSSITGGVSGFTAGIAIMGGFSWFFGYLGGQPQLSMRFMAIKDKKQAIKARNVGVIWTVFAYLGALCIGWIGIAIFGPKGLSDPETVMPKVMLTVFPPAFAAILITGAIAAMISTADSLLILSATELSQNILKQQSRKSLGYARCITAILAVVALLLAYITPSNLIYTLVGYVWAGIGGTFSVIILLTLFWKRFHGMAVVITIISGMLFTIIWISSGMESRITARFLTFIVALIVAVVSTLVLNRKKRHEITAV